MSHSRLIAARTIAGVLKGQSLSTVLTQQLTTITPINSSRDKAFVQMLCYGVCRFYPQLEFILNLLLTKPLPVKEYDVHALLLVGLYQLMYMRVPPHAALSETVNALRLLKKPWARGLTNAILREYLRSKDSLKDKIKTQEEAYYAHPQWMIDAIKDAWPTQWQTILAANNTQPPLSLRVNRLKTTREAYLTQCDGQLIAETDSGVILKSAAAVTDLPGFSTGHVSVQDGAAQLAAQLLKLAPHLKVLDACAAPGGKLTHILETEPLLAHCLAIEKDAARLPAIRENLTRLNLHAECVVADAASPNQYWDGHLFDRILCDVPCSASGIIRRHPDIKMLRKPDDITANAQQQLRLLTALWPLLKVDGILLYATCSILPTENVEVVAAFMQTHQDAIEDKIEASWGEACSIGRQILSGVNHNPATRGSACGASPDNKCGASMDGFYYARLRKR